MAPATVRRAPYKDFLQPALHRRFSSTASFLFVLSYAIAILLGSFNSFLWSWFPIGPVGFRTAFLFASALAVIVLRISQYHVGIRASASPFLSAVPNLFTIQFLEAWLFYGFSSGLFGMVYLWSAADSGDLRWIKVTSGDRVRLNQKPVFVAFYLAVSAAIQAFLHIARDEDRIEIDVTKRKQAASGGAPSSKMTLVLSRLPAVFIESFMKASISWALAYTFYATIFQRPVWAWAMAFFRPFYNLPKTNIVPSEGVFKVSLIARCTWSGFLLFIVWNVGNYAFSLFMVKEPLKNGKPLTSESKDPNGSLLNGLKSKKMPIRCFAFWELAFIARDFEIRRKAIYEDIDRKDGPMWSQVYVICLDVIKTMEKRIDDYGKPPPPPVVAPAEPAAIETRTRASAPPKDDPIFQSRPASKTMRGEVEKALGQAVRDPGQTPLSQLSPRAMKTLRGARDKMLTPEQQQAFDPARASGFVQALSLLVVQNEHVGWIFRQSFRRRFSAAVLGTPYSETSHHINAVDALTHLIVHSLSEDKFGNVHRDVTSIVRTFTIVIRKLEAFRRSFPVHWTDTDKSRDAPEVDAVVSALKTGLADIIKEFEPYAADLRLSRTDIRLAKEASVQEPAASQEQVEGVGRPEMTQTRTAGRRSQQCAVGQRAAFHPTYGDEPEPREAAPTRHLNPTPPSIDPMLSPRTIFRFIYNSSYLILCTLTTALLLVTPGDVIYQALRNKQINNIWLLASCVIGTLVIVSFVYALRLYNNKTILASIPKAWIPIEKGDVPKRVFNMITDGLDRSAAIAYEARPRHVPDIVDSGDLDQQSVVSAAPGNGNQNGEKGVHAAAEGFQLLKMRTHADVERMLGSPLPQHRPVWGEIEHGGWAPPDSADIPNLQYSTVMSELPHLIEAKALTLAPVDPAVEADPPVLDPEAVLLLQRPPHFGLRQYLTHLAELGVLPLDATTTDFLTLYEHARFSSRPIRIDQFRDTMHLFAALLRSMGPLDPAILYPPDDDDRGTASDSDIDNYAPNNSNPTTPRSSLSRSGTRSTTGSQRRTPFGARSASASTWHHQYRTAPSTINARSTGSLSRTSSVIDFARSRRPYHSSSNASMRSKASSGSGASVIRLAGRADVTDLPYVLSLTDSR